MNVFNRETFLSKSLPMGKEVLILLWIFIKVTLISSMLSPDSVVSFIYAGF